MPGWWKGIHGTLRKCILRVRLPPRVLIFMGHHLKYTPELLRPLVENSISLSEVLRKLGKGVSGGLHSHLKRRLIEFKIDTSHFLGKAHYLGKASTKRKRWEIILVLRTKGGRTRASQLKRALIDSGREYRCITCGIGPTWCWKSLTLQVDHKNRNWLDDRKENLFFRCPNCHSQTSGWCGRKNKGRVVKRQTQLIQD